MSRIFTASGEIEAKSDAIKDSERIKIPKTKLFFSFEIEKA